MKLPFRGIGRNWRNRLGGVAPLKTYEQFVVRAQSRRKNSGFTTINLATADVYCRFLREGRRAERAGSVMVR